MQKLVGNVADLAERVRLGHLPGGNRTTTAARKELGGSAMDPARCVLHCIAERSISWLFVACGRFRNEDSFLGNATAA